VAKSLHGPMLTAKQSHRKPYLYLLTTIASSSQHLPDHYRLSLIAFD
jgi:hypothetical protein